MGCAPSAQKRMPSDITQRKIEQVNSDIVGNSADDRSIKGMDNQGKPSDRHIVKDEIIDEDSEPENGNTGVFHNKSQDEILQILKAISTTALTNEGLMKENGEFYIETSRAFYMYHKAFFQLNYVKNATKDDLEKFRKDVAQVTLDTKFFHAVADLTQTLYKLGLRLTQEMFYCLFFTYCQSYSSVEFVEGVVRAPGFLETVKQILIDHKQEFLEEEDKVSFLAQMAESCLGILDYVAMKDQIARLHDLDLLTTLKPYLGSAINKQRLMTLMVVAVIINEDECEILNTQPDIINYLINDAKLRLAANRKEGGDFSCYECAFVIRQLARNDENKRILVQIGALPVLVRIGDTAEEDKLEKYEVVHGIWALCFDKENAKLVANNQDLGVVELLLKLKTSEDDGIRKACNGALWTLQDALLSSKVDFYREVGAKFEKENKKRRRKNKKEDSEGQHKGGHIMISYQWANQQILKVVRDRVKANGYKVWMDIDEMGGSTLQAMAEAVENAAMILICMSQKYKNSSNCRAEAEYAFQKKKLIIPLKLERGYEPDGWLGFICGTKVFFEFTDKYPFEEKMTSLLKEIACVLKQSLTEPGAKGDNIDGSIVPVRQQQTHAAPPVVVRRPELSSGIVISPFKHQACIDDISKWSQTQCQDWINKHDLSGYGLDKIGGKEVAMLATMWIRAPEAFYKCLRVTMNITDLTTMAKLDYAVRILVAPSTEDPSQ